MGKGKWIFVFLMIFVLVLGVGAGIYMNIMLSRNLDRVSQELTASVNAADARVYQRLDEWITKQEEEEIPKEDYVRIAGSYEILPTTNISDAYKSGDDSALNDKEKEILKMATEVINQIIKDDMSDYEKELAVYQWLVTYTSQDTGMLLPIPSSGEDADNPYGVLKYKNAVCVGYATTFRLFMQMMDIECMVVHNTDNFHSWDLVKLDGEWYHTDIYSDAGSISYRNFNMDDRACSVGHDWDRTFFPAANGRKYNYKSQGSVKLKNVYSLPKKVKKILDEGNSCTEYYFLTKAEAEKNYRVAEAILGMIQERLPYDIYGDMAFYWDWTEVNKDGVDGYCLGIYVDFYRGSGPNASNISDEQREKAEKAVSDVFGSLQEGLQK